jgi:superfamily II DNA or RNA helicase
MIRGIDNRYGLDSLYPWQRSFVDGFLASPRNTVLQAPLGIGKSRAAGEIAAAMARKPGRVLVVASELAVGRQIASSARHSGVETLAITKGRLREGDENGDLGLPRQLVAYTTPQTLAGDWSLGLLSGVGWSSIILDHPRDADFPWLQEFIARAGTPVLVLTDSEGLSQTYSWLDDPTIHTHSSELLLEENRPRHVLSARFEPYFWARTARERQIIAMVDALPGSKLTGGLDTIRVARLRTAAASSSYALQVAALAELQRLTEAYHAPSRFEALGDSQPILGAAHPADHLASAALDTTVVSTSADGHLLEAIASLSAIASAVDELEDDPKQDALMTLIREHGAENQTGSVVFCALSATADYLATELAAMQSPVTRVFRNQVADVDLGPSLADPRGLVVVHDGALQGLDLHAASQGINYDLVASRRRMNVRWSRLNWTDPGRLRVWTLIPRESRSSAERIALQRMPYLAGSGWQP